MIYIIISLITWIIYTFFEGAREANYNHNRNSLKISKPEINISLLCNIQRIFILSSIGFCLSSNISYTLIGLPILSMILIFPYIHNGTYFIIRNKLDPNVFTKGSSSNCNDVEDVPTIYLENKLRNNLAIIGLLILIIVLFIG